MPRRSPSSDSCCAVHALTPGIGGQHDEQLDPVVSGRAGTSRTSAIGPGGRYLPSEPDSLPSANVLPCRSSAGPSAQFEVDEVSRSTGRRQLSSRSPAAAAGLRSGAPLLVDAAVGDRGGRWRSRGSGTRPELPRDRVRSARCISSRKSEAATEPTDSSSAAASHLGVSERTPELHGRR